MRVSDKIKTAGDSASKVRSLKIYSKYREYRRDKHAAVQYDLIPEIRLSGFWLEDLGFLRGMRVLLLLEPGSITLKLVEQPTEGETLSRA